MADDIAIKIDHVNKSFKLPHEKNSSIKGAVLNFYKRKKTYEKQQVLKDINLEIKRGEFYGIVGRNGSGKSTLLKLLAGIYSPDDGSIQINGKLTPFIELGVGFSPELTGRENVFLNGALLGFNRTEMNALYPDIVAFAELEKFMDQKLKNYSSGMQVRLAFSIAIRARSDILLLDEVLAVGDAAFQKKCFDYFMRLKKDKQTVILVTHDMNAIRQYCDRAIMINDGELMAEGGPEEIAQVYQRFFSSLQETQPKKQTHSRRWGNGRLVVYKADVNINDDNISLDVLYKAKANLPSPTFGFTVYNSAGINILESNTTRLNFKTDNVKKGQSVSMRWILPNILKSGSYTVSVACCDRSAIEFYDWLNEAVSFKVNKKNATAGTVDPLVELSNYKADGGKHD